MSKYVVEKSLDTITQSYFVYLEHIRKYYRYSRYPHTCVYVKVIFTELRLVQPTLCVFAAMKQLT